MMKKNKVIAASALALTITLAGGAALTGHAFAAPSRAAAVSEATSQSAVKDVSMGRGGDHGFRAKLDEAKLAALLGMTEADLQTELRAGKSLAAIAEAKRVAVQSVVDLVVEQLTTNLNQKLEDGKLTQEQYDAKLAELPDKASKLVNSAHTGKGGHRGHGPKPAKNAADTADSADTASAV